MTGPLSSSVTPGLSAPVKGFPSASEMLLVLSVVAVASDMRGSAAAALNAAGSLVSSFVSPFSTSAAVATAWVRRRLRRRSKHAAIIAMIRRTTTAAPTPMPIFAPDARPELPPPEDWPFEDPFSLEPPSLGDGVLPDALAAPDVAGLFPEAELPCVPLTPPVGLADEPPPLVTDAPADGDPADGDPVSAGDESLVGSPDGVWPAWKLMLSPVALGKAANCARLFASLNAVGVNLAASVQLQNEPGCSVDGFPSCEQAPQTPSLSSHSVRAIHGWSGCHQYMNSNRFFPKNTYLFLSYQDSSCPCNLGPYIQLDTSNPTRIHRHDVPSKRYPPNNYPPRHSKSDTQTPHCHTG